jgi:hypothetical protein
MILLSIACNISAIGNAVDRGDPFREVVGQSIEESKRMEKEYPPGDVASGCAGRTAPAHAPSAAPGETGYPSGTHRPAIPR